MGYEVGRHTVTICEREDVESNGLCKYKAEDTFTNDRFSVAELDTGSTVWWMAGRGGKEV